MCAHREGKVSTDRAQVGRARRFSRYIHSKVIPKCSLPGYLSIAYISLRSMPRFQSTRLPESIRRGTKHPPCFFVCVSGSRFTISSSQISFRDPSFFPIIAVIELVHKFEFRYLQRLRDTYPLASHIYSSFQFRRVLPLESIRRSIEHFS